VVPTSPQQVWIVIFQKHSKKENRRDMSNINEQQIAQMAVQQLLASAAHAERQIDAELAAMSKLDGDDLERLRHKRIAELKAQQAKVQEWRRKGHGKYEVRCYILLVDFILCD
jgi:hypothetical protein